jgi:hypothetical protein
MSQDTNESTKEEPAKATSRRRRELEISDFASGARTARIVCFCIALVLLLIGLVLIGRLHLIR